MSSTASDPWRHCWLNGTVRVSLADEHIIPSFNVSIITYQKMPLARVVHEVWVVTQHLVREVNLDVVLRQTFLLVFSY